jgi:hypothetical protein
MILGIILIILAAICNAVMDKVLYHYFKSIFIKLDNQQWWDVHSSWQNKYHIDEETGFPDYTKRKKWLWGLMNYPVQLTDAWHFFKMLMLLFIISAAVVYKPFSIFNNGLDIWINILVLGIIYNSTFSLFFKKIFHYEN